MHYFLANCQFFVQKAYSTFPNGYSWFGTSSLCMRHSSCTIAKTATIAYHGFGVLMVAGTEIGEWTSIGVGVKFIRKFPFKNVPKVGKYVYIGLGVSYLVQLLLVIMLLLLQMRL